MYVLPDYADQFLSMIVKILQEYRLVTNNTYKSKISVYLCINILLNIKYFDDENNYHDDGLYVLLM